MKSMFTGILTKLFDSIRSDYNVYTGGFDPHFGCDKAKIYANEASISLQKGNEAASNFSENAGKINIKPILVTGMVAAGCVVAGAAAPASAICATAGTIGSLALGHPVVAATAATYFAFPKETEGLVAIPQNYTKAAAQGAQAVYFKVRGWSENEQVISPEVAKLCCIDFGDTSMISSEEHLSSALDLVGANCAEVFNVNDIPCAA